VGYFIGLIMLVVYEIIITSIPILSPYKQIFQIGVPTVIIFALLGLGRKRLG
jgi:hypothetical protein